MRLADRFRVPPAPCALLGLAGVLLAGCGDAAAPADDFSPVLVADATSGGVPELWLVDTLGGARPLQAGPRAGLEPVPSPDGRWLLFVTADYEQWTGDVWIVGRDGAGLRRLTTAPELDDQPAWSPDGSRIAFRSFRTGRDGDIWVMNADGTGAVNLTPDPLPGVTDERRPAWSPDGRRIAFASTRGGNMDLWVMAADGSDPRRLTATEDFDTEPAWGPDGTIAFRRSAPGIGSDILLLPPGGGDPVRLGLPGEQRLPAWSPDGSLLAYLDAPALGAPAALYTMRPDGTGVRRRLGAPEFGSVGRPAWLPPAGTGPSAPKLE